MRALTPGTPLTFVNQDGTTHNLHARQGRRLLWSKNLVGPDANETLTLEKPGIVSVRSRGMDWMTHYVWVVDHAAYTNTDSKDSQLSSILKPQKSRQIA